MAEKTVTSCELFMPDNEYGIPEGYCEWSDLVALLRNYKNNPEAIQFIADMME